MESKFVAASQTTARALGVLECLKEIGIKKQMPAVLHVDNQAAFAQLEGENTPGRVKHIDIRHNFVKAFAKKKVLNIKYCETRKMCADILTKRLQVSRLKDVRELVMLSDRLRGNECRKVAGIDG
ncbi:Copia protein [Phytophthora citrophthora]|uniref:Copia protein n=1 Tax=Phytophthora citrophthora TaxID=4793 RepID=A0AAD9G338_9STRA|nr:Copia protein [Phytophthora citrophthora]